MDAVTSAMYALSNDSFFVSQALLEDPDVVRERRRRRVLALVVIFLGAVVALLIVSDILDWNFDQVWRYETVGLLGATVGTAELVSRYRDAPWFVLLSPPGVAYIAINAAASLLALAVIQAFGWTFGASGSGVAATQVLFAGFGSMALFRSSLLTVKAGNDDVGIGPSSVLSILMAATDRSADRLRASDRAGRVKKIMKRVSYEKAQDALPTVALALMQNVAPADATAFRTEIAGLKNEKLPDPTKAFLLGLKITNLVSTDVLLAAKDSLDDSILNEEPTSVTKSEEPTTATKPDEPTTANGQHKEGAERRVNDLVTAALPKEGDDFASEQLPQTPQTPNPDDEAGPPATDQ
jgi:hypothetical protein